MSKAIAIYVGLIVGIGMVITLAGTCEAGEPVGRLSRHEVAKIFKDQDRLPLEEEALAIAARALERVAPGAEITIFFGARCHDSEREIPYLLALLDRLEHAAPFTVEFVAVNRDKTMPPRELKLNEVHYLPTIIVSRQGSEIGRIVQRPARSVDTDLIRLLDGTARGLLSSDEAAILDYLHSPRTRGTSRPTVSGSRSDRQIQLGIGVGEQKWSELPLHYDGRGLLGVAIGQ